MSDYRPTIVLVLKNGKGFGFRDVELIVRHILGKWESVNKPRIICLWNKASEYYDLGNLEIIPLRNNFPGTWSRIELYSPEMEQYRPFLYIDLDTAVINSLENMFALVKDPTKVIVLEDFYQKRKLATPLVWFPANSAKIRMVWKRMKRGIALGKRMDFFLRKVLTPDLFWQDLTNTIHDFKPSKKPRLAELAKGTDLVCFHGKPRIFDAQAIPWIKEYVLTAFRSRVLRDNLVTVIIPYNKDRGWLNEAIASVPEGVQLIPSKGDGGWPENFNKALPQATGKYIKYLHEDDMLTPNCIEDSVKAIEDLEVDFIHGNATELYQDTGKRITKRPRVTEPTVQDLMIKNTIHSTTTMYRREIFEKLGGFDETLDTQEEYEFNLRCLKAGFKIGYCDATLAVYRRHPDQKVRVASKLGKEKEKQLVNARYE